MSRPIGTAVELERRRRLAVERVHQGEAPSLVARILGVPRSTLFRWRQLDQQGPDGLRAHPSPGPSPRLSDEQLRQLEALLLQGATNHGWPNALWTGPRVRELIRRHFNVTLHPDHIVRMLRQRLHWTSQKPQRRARQRDPKEVERWKADEFPRIVREAHQRSAHLVFLDESGFQLAPTLRRTLAPRGQTPIVACDGRRDKVSAISAITLSPQQARLGLYFRLLEPKENVRAPDVVAFLRQLKQHIPGELTVVWDRSRTHGRSKLVRAYLAQHPEIVTEDFPGYAPELNPDELVWSWTKYGRLCNWAPADAEELWEGVWGELYDLRKQPDLLASFINQVNLPLRL
jgi:transposase